MRNRAFNYFGSFLTAFVIAALLAGPAPVMAQDAYGSWIQKIIGAPVVSRAFSAVRSDTALIIKYIGTNANGGTVTVAAGGDITFSQGAVGSSVADASLKCPSGGSSGIVDVSDTACDTLGEVVDVINATSNWRAVIQDGLRSDSSNDTLTALSETAANKATGLALTFDTAVAFWAGVAMIPIESRDDIRFWLPKTIPTTSTSVLNFKTNPFVGTRSLLFHVIETTTYGSGTSTLNIYCRVPNLSNRSAGTETVYTLYSQAGGATTVAASFSPAFGLVGCNDGVMLVRVVNSAAMTASAMTVHGYMINPTLGNF